MLAAEPTSTAANAINALGIDLFRRVCRPQANALLSPYSIQRALVMTNYDAPFEALDFARNASGATRHINLWVEEKTRRRICNLIPDGALGNLTRLVLVNALYLKAPWMMEFSESATQLRQFYLEGSRPIAVPTMTGRHNVSYVKRDGFSVAAIP